MMGSVDKAANKNVEYAGFWRRYAASLVDILVSGFLTFILIGIFTIISLVVNDSITGNKTVNPIPIFLVLLSLLITPFTYLTFFWVKKNGQTLGNKLLNIKILSLDHKTITFKHASIRYGILLLEFVIVFYLVNLILGSFLMLDLLLSK